MNIIKGYSIRHNVAKYLIYRFSKENNLNPQVAFCKILGTETYNTIMNDDNDIYLRPLPALYEALVYELSGNRKEWLRSLME